MYDSISKQVYDYHNLIIFMAYFDRLKIFLLNHSGRLAINRMCLGYLLSLCFILNCLMKIRIQVNYVSIFTLINLGKRINIPLCQQEGC
jgi:hypothetical protein